jgi:predicted PurR-regulated permease PerM
MLNDYRQDTPIHRHRIFAYSCINKRLLSLRGLSKLFAGECVGLFALWRRQEQSQIMSYQRSVLFWIAASVILAGTIVLLREILLPFLVGIALAYLLDPLVTRFERLGLGRSVAALGIIGLFYVSIIALIIEITPILGDEVATFIEKFPGYVTKLQALANDPGRPWLHKIISEGLREAQQSTGELTTVGANLSANLLHILWSDGRALISIFSLLVVVPIVTFYLLVDWEQIVAALDKMVPPTQRETVRTLAREINETVAVFLRGQGMICLILALYYAVSLRFTGLNHAYLIGLSAGLVSFIPYLGLLTGLVLSISVALIQFWPSWSLIPIILGIFLFGQLFADYVLAPRLVGARVKLNPVSIMFAIAAFGYLFGFIGLLIAVPLAAAIGVIVRSAIAHGAGGLFEDANPTVSTTDIAAPGLPLKKRRWWL